MAKGQKVNSKQVEELSVKQLYDSFREPLKLELVSGQNGINRMIGERSLNRPALALTGFLKFFASKRIQLFGAGEMGYLRSLKVDEEELILRTIFFKKIPCIIISTFTPISTYFFHLYNISLIKIVINLYINNNNVS